MPKKVTHPGGIMKNSFLVMCILAFLLINHAVCAQEDEFNASVVDNATNPENNTTSSEDTDENIPPLETQAPQNPVTYTAPQSESPQIEKLSLDIKGMDITDVLKMLATRARLNIVVGKNVTGRVTLFLKDVSPWDAFEIILLSNELAYEQEGDIINILTQRDYELKYGEPFKDKKQVKIISLKYAKASDISRALSQIKTNVGRIVIDEGSNTLVLIDVAEKIKEMVSFIRTIDLPVETRIFSLNYAQADKLQPKIQESLTKGVGSLKIDERTNKIAITDYPEKLDELGTIIAAFDEKTAQVIIDAQIIEITPNKDEFTMGVDWDYWLKKNVRLISALSAPALTSASTIPTKLTFGVATKGTTTAVGETGEYKSIIDALRVIGETKILSSPRIMALNNQEAKILVGTKEAYITSTTSQSGTGSTVTSQTVNFVDVGIKLFVTPTINRDGFVTIKVKPEVSSSTSTNIKSEGQDTTIPIVTTSEAETTIMVKDGTTIMIAGLKKDRNFKEEKKIPLLGDIPGLGVFFKNKKAETTKTELVIFLTPRIVSGEEPLEYSSLTQDKDITRIYNLSQRQYAEKIAEIDGYTNTILSKIETACKQAKIANQSLRGEIEVVFTLFANGYLKGNPLILSSTDPQSAQTTITCIKNAGPFPSFPSSLKKEEETFKIGLSFE
jgi:MSHA type pilus biogenesis protein MshL